MAGGRHSPSPGCRGTASPEERRPLLSKAKTIAVLSSATSASKPSIDDILTVPTAQINEENRSNPEEDMESAIQDYQPMGHAAFYKMIGLRVPTEEDYIACLEDLEEGNGLYHDIRTSHAAMQRWHFWFEVGIYTALLGQILLSAQFIILGAMRGDHHVPIAILGAFSVAVAGILALVKGQGLPMRLRIIGHTPRVRRMSRSSLTQSVQERDALWEVQLEAEELHWQVSAGKPVLFSDVKRVWQRFVQVKRDASMNHPDTWNTSTAAAAQAQAAGVGGKSPLSAASPAGKTAATAPSVEGDTAAMASLEPIT
ncbi:hypothetical protein LTR78_005931 [Recurvomyces mirabilis]|uniref:SMODS and SLOG-associating 2TM effector domain-containing protein n=1 Tax=Recurvomyces mirabilis TaxID=574656 RepID=A0AAE0WLS9_9PEZI|nr:hypothetical protein LTR78_005931 [Recurvomyces mirabilis]KAK5155259.1 hypothetical protein LTS14_006214 [Recurvomyces mirabilis]